MDYILGPEVKGRDVTDTDGQISKSPSWSLVMHYEFKIRSKASEFMNEGGGAESNGAKMDIAGALTAASRCLELRQREFLEKLQLQGNRASSSHSGNSQQGKGGFQGGVQKVKKEQKQKKGSKNAKGEKRLCEGQGQRQAQSW